MVSESKYTFKMAEKCISPGTLHVKLNDLAKGCLEVATRTATWENLQKKVSDPKY
jgi:hypothetical protein